MKDWMGKSYDYIIERLGSLITKQKWKKFKKWTDFPDGKWKSLEMTKETFNYSDPPYKFFWWWLRYYGIIKEHKIDKTEMKLEIEVNICATQYISWQHFSTWQEWSEATGGTWYYWCPIGIA
jgi:hypothetical protein